MAASWEELEQKYSGGVAGVAPASDPWSALEEKYGAPAGVKSDDKPSKRAEPRPEATWLERGMALPAGVNRGVTALAGLPVDTIQNVIDLGKAGFGSLAHLAGRPDLAPDVSLDRSGVVGSSDWIAKKINKGAETIGVRSPIDNPRPDDIPSRVAYSGGMFAGSSINPNPQAKIGPVQQAINTGTGTAGGMLAGITGEVAPEWAGLAAMTPSTVAMMTAGGTKLAVRGGEDGRKRMEQRVQDLKAGGIDEPSVGLASGNRTVMGLENLLAQTPFSSEMYRVRGEKNIAGMQSRTNQIRDAVSTDFGPVAAGSAVQRDLKGSFKARIGDTARNLNDRVEAAVGTDRLVPIPETMSRAQQLTAPIKGAEATSSQLINARIDQIAKNLRADVFGAAPVMRMKGGNQNPTLNAAVEPSPGMPPANASLWNATPPSVPQTVANPSLWNAPATQISPMPRRDVTMVQPGNMPANASLWNAQKDQGLPFGALKGLRTSIGEEAASSAIMGTPEQAQFKRLYGAMSDDMRQAVNAADRTQAGVPVGPLLPSQQPGAVALNRANSFYSKAMDRADDLNSLANRSTPEGAYNTVANSLNAGPTLYQKLRGAVTPETRQKVVATVVDEMGTATPGRQNAAGDAWSPQTFLTNFNRMDGQTRTELFKRLPGGANHGKALDDVAKAAEMVGDASKIWANPSGTAPALTARGTFYALTAGAFLHPLGAAATAGGLALGNQATKRLLLNPRFVKWLSEAPTVKPEQMQVHAQRLASVTKFSNDQQFKQDVLDYLQSVKDGAQDGNGYVN